MIVTIDGPAGAGKSSAARALAQRLGFRFLDTGALYRAVTLAAKRDGVDWQSPDQLLKVACSISVDLTDNSVLLNGEDVTKELRSLEITTLTRHAADHVGVRQKLTGWQRQLAEGSHCVTEGRDQATEVFPDAQCKVFLTASEGVRAERRFNDLIARGEQVTREEVLEKQRARDARDTERGVGGLHKTPDSIEISTDGLTQDEVVDVLEGLVKERLPG
ncbi:MAG: (d)CMP kinase [Planctomycetota bacterium]